MKAATLDNPRTSYRSRPTTGRSTSTTTEAAALEAKDERRRVGQLWLVLILTFLYTAAGQVVNLIVGGRLPASFESTGRVAVTALGTEVTTLGTIAFYGGSAALFFYNFIRRDRKAAPGWPVLLLLGFFLSVSLMNFFGSNGTSLRIGSRVGIVLVLVLWSIRPKIRDLRVIGIFGTLVALGSFALIPSGKAWMLRADFALVEKALVGQDLLGGIFPQSNIMGLAMAACAPFALLMKRRLVGVVSFLIMAGALLLTSSRTSLIGFGIALAVAIVALLFRRPKSVSMVHGIAAVGMGIGTIVLPLVTKDWHAFTDRGGIWSLSRQEWKSPEQFLLGNGLEFYGLGSTFARKFGSPSYHGHNEFVTILTMSGAVTVCVFIVVMIIAFRGASYASVGRRPALFALLSLLGISIAETPLRIDTVDILPWATWFGLIAIVMAGANERADALEEARNLAEGGAAEPDPAADGAPDPQEPQTTPRRGARGREPAMARRTLRTAPR